MHLCSEPVLRRFTEEFFLREGFEKAEAERIADVLLLADLFGIESHGMQRLHYYHENLKSGSINPRAEMEMLRESAVSAFLDAHFAMGQLAAWRGMELAMEKAAKNGIGVCVVRNSSHFGIAGYYTHMALEKGLCSFSMTNTGPIMVPTFGTEMMLGTNPLAFAMPAEPIPLWFDAATTTVPLGRIEVYDKEERPLPEGWALQADGTPARDAHLVNQRILSGDGGGLLPLGGAGEETGGHKGYGLALMVEALTSVLADGLTCPEMTGAHGDHTSHFFLCLDPDLFGGRAEARASLSRYLQSLRGSAKVPGRDRIFTPGEKAWENRARRLLAGIPVEDRTWEEMGRDAHELGLQLPPEIK